MKAILFGIVLLVVLAVAIAAQAETAAAAQPVKTEIWYQNQLVRTLLPPAHTPKEGTDVFYMVPGVGGVAALAPGDLGYHGGHWKVFVASGVSAGDIATYGGLNSASEVMQAATAGAIVLTRRADLDFLCPIQP
jgi:opacity protein-like surface antigen